MIDLIQPLKNRLKTKIKAWPCHANRASLLGDACERQLVYWRTSWDQAALHDEEVQAIFEEGHHQEQKVLMDLMDSGIEVIEQQRPLSWDQYQITGHVDAVVVWEGKAVPVEIKSAHPNIFSTLFKRGMGVYSWDEVQEGFQKKPWLKKYFAQLQLYMLFKNTDHGLFLFKNKSNGCMAQVNVELDYVYTEGLIQKAERINKHVADGTMPPRIEFQNDICRRCPFGHLCCPDDIAKDEWVTIPNSDVVKWCEDRQANYEAYLKYNKAHKSLLSWVKARGNGQTGKYLVGEWAIIKKAHGKGCTIELERMNDDRRRID